MPLSKFGKLFMDMNERGPWFPEIEHFESPLCPSLIDSKLWVRSNFPGVYGPFKRGMGDSVNFPQIPQAPQRYPVLLGEQVIYVEDFVLFASFFPPGSEQPFVGILDSKKEGKVTCEIDGVC